MNLYSAVFAKKKKLKKMFCWDFSVLSIIIVLKTGKLIVFLKIIAIFFVFISVLMYFVIIFFFLKRFEQCVSSQISWCVKYLYCLKSQINFKNQDVNCPVFVRFQTFLLYSQKTSIVDSIAFNIFRDSLKKERNFIHVVF